MTPDRPTVVVVGAGLAGLACADRLAGRTNVHLFEARSRVGGRCWSSHGWADGQVAEHGGELIETGQDHILGLVRELGLELESRQPQRPAIGSARIAGHQVDLDQVDGLDEVVRTLAAELGGLAGVTFDTTDDRARALDEMSVGDWIDDRIAGGSASLLGAAVTMAVCLNLGFQPNELSALSLHHMFVGLADEPGRGPFAFGNEAAAPTEGSDTGVHFGGVARAAVTHGFHVRGGNDLIAHGLAARLPPGVLHLESPVASVRRTSDGTYVLRLTDRPTQVRAHRVVLATPLPTLREVDLTAAQLSPRRIDAVESMHMGQNSKILLQMTTRLDALSAWPGFAVSDHPMVTAWDSSVEQPGQAGILTLFGQGPLPARVDGGHGPAPEPVRHHAEGVLRRISPELVAHVGDAGWVDAWVDDPWAGGSYSGYGPGQYTRFSGFLSQPDGGIHFAGEHTSLSSPGYLDGAVGSGHRAAEQVLVSLGLSADGT